jgi:multiple sugar transport system ATP-binding protein
MGRAIARTPQAFLMDEPLSNLDAKLRGLMRAEIKAIQKLTGITTIYVTHDQVEAMTMGHRVAVMKDGKIQQLGPPKDLYKNPVNMFVASFLGAPSMNMVKCRLEQKSDFLFAYYGDKVISLGGELATRLSSYNLQSVVIGIRPEHLKISKDDSKIESGDDNLVITGEVLLVEELGSSNLVHLNANIISDADAADMQDRTSSILQQADILAVLDNEYIPEAKQIINLFTEDYNVHLFNPDTGQAI